MMAKDECFKIFNAALYNFNRGISHAISLNEIAGASKSPMEYKGKI
jgi:hypothetical protein